MNTDGHRCFEFVCNSPLLRLIEVRSVFLAVLSVFICVHLWLSFPRVDSADPSAMR